MADSIGSIRALSERLTGEGGGLHLNWGERIVTVVAASLAVLIVATIAVLMGIT